MGSIRARVAACLWGLGVPLAAGVGPATAQAVDRGAEESIVLRLGAREGETVRYRYEQQLSIAMPAALGGEQVIATAMTLDQMTRAATGDTIRYRTRISDVRVDMEASPYAAVDGSGLEGQEVELALDRRGRVIALEGEDPLAITQARQSLAQFGFAVLPQDPVSVGDSWSDTLRTDPGTVGLAMGGEIISLVTTTLERLVDSDGGVVADLLVETTFAYEAGDAAGLPGIGLEMTGSRAERVRFDVTAGRYLEGAGSQDFTINISAPAQAGSYSIQGLGQSSLIRLDP